MNNYPDSFYNNCKNYLPCDSSDKDCKINNKQLSSLRNLKIEKELRINRLNNNKKKTSKCKAYEQPIKILKSDINFPCSDLKTWSNSNGFGNIEISSNSLKNDILKKVTSWNRLNRLNEPSNTRVNKNMAWVVINR